MLRLRQTINREIRSVRKGVLHELSSDIDRSIQSNNNRLPHNFIQNMIAEAKPIYPWLTYGKLINYNRAHAKKIRKTLMIEANRCVFVQ